jgi:hypothetical protein
MTNKRALYHVREKEKRDSRIKQTRKFILENTTPSLLNNHKWYKIFELVEQYCSEFELKILLSSELKNSNQIYELEQSSILVDNSGDFIEFLELEELTLENSPELNAELKKLNIEFLEESNKLTIQGYRK